MAPWVACDTSVMSTLGLLTLQQTVKYPLDNPTRRSTLKYMLNQLAPDQVFHALGDSTRRRLVEHLSRGPASVSDLAKPLGITLAAVVQHLQVLERSGVVRTQKVGRVRTCHIEHTGLNVAAEWIADRQSLWERRLDRLGDMLAEEDQTTGRPARERDNT
jgi:DNA-binding transcriptional ArsR family regulator